MTGLDVTARGRSDDPTTVPADGGTTLVAPAPAPAPTTPGGAGAPRDMTVFPGFDGLRAIAALLVLLVHAGFYTTLTLDTPFGPYSARGEIGVAVFFLISGFLLYRPFVAAHLAGRPGPDTGGFLIRRFMRIVPLYWLALVISLVVISDKMIVTSLTGMLQCLFFIQGYRQAWALQGLTQAWTLDVEVAFYLFLPVYAWLLGKGRPRSPRTQLWLELTGVATLFLLGNLIHWRMIGTRPGSLADGWNVWLPVWWDLFSMGMFLAVVSAWYGRTGRTPRWATLPGSGTVCWIAAGVCYWIAANKIGLPRWPIYDASVRTDMGKHLFYGLFGFFLLLPAVSGPQRRGLVRRFLASRVMVFLGTISYGIYLWHQTVIDLVMHHSGWKIWQVSFLPFFIPVLAITVALSALTYYLVERPCQRLAKEWAGRWKNRRAGQAVAAAPAPAPAVPLAAGSPVAVPVPAAPALGAAVPGAVASAWTTAPAAREPDTISAANPDPVSRRPEPGRPETAPSHAAGPGDPGPPAPPVRPAVRGPSPGPDGEAPPNEAAAPR